MKNLPIEKKSCIESFKSWVLFMQEDNTAWVSLYWLQRVLPRVLLVALNVRTVRRG